MTAITVPATQEADPTVSVEPLVIRNDETERDAENDNATFSTGSAPAATAEVVRLIVTSSVAEVERHLEHESTVATIAETASSVAVPLDSAQVQGEPASRIAQQKTESPKEAVAVESAASLQDSGINIGDSARISVASSVRSPAPKAETHDNQQDSATPSAPAVQRENTSGSAQEDSSLPASVQQEIVDIEMRIDPASLSLPSDSLHQSDSGRIAQASDDRSTLIVDDPMQGNQEDEEMEEAVEQESGIVVMEDDLNVEDDTEMETGDLVVETDVVMVGADIPTSTLAHITAPETPVGDVDMEGDIVAVEHDVTMYTVETQAPSNLPPAQGYAPEAVMEDAITQTPVSPVAPAMIATPAAHANVPARLHDLNIIPASLQIGQPVRPIRNIEPLQVERVIPAVPIAQIGQAVQPLQASQAVRPTVERPSPLASAFPRQNASPTVQPRSLVDPAVWPRRPEASLFMPKKKPIRAATRPASSNASSNVPQGVMQAPRPGNEKLWNLTKPQDPTRVKTIHAAKTSLRPADHQFKVPALPARLSQPAPVASGGTLAAFSSSTNATPPRSQAMLPAALTSLAPPPGQRLSLVAMSSTDAAEEEEMNAMPRTSPPPAYAMPRNADELARRDQEETQRIIAEFRAKKAANEEGDTSTNGGHRRRDDV